MYVLTIARAIRTGETGEALCSHARATAERMSSHPKVAKALADAVSAPPADFMTHAGWVLLALQNAFYQPTHAASLESGVVSTVRRGGDTDTNAAITAALLGAAHGVEAVPQQWRSAVLSCRPGKSAPGAQQPRPERVWPVDCLDIAANLCEQGRKAAVR